MDKRFEGKTPEQILEMLTLEQKCGQLVSTGIGCWEECETAMEHHVGNLSVIYGHDAEALARFKADMERLQREADIPFFIGVDMETGVGQTVHDRSIATEFAEQMAIGAIADLKDAERLAYEEGRVVSQQASYLGWNICFGPVVDVNINPENPITNIRSFGEDPDIVATLAAAYIKGLQSDGRLIGTAKHFPGAGMQFSDSHFALEKTRTTKEEMEKDELVRAYLLAADNFVVYRPTFGLHTLIAGYPWFLDWGRDALISFEGLTLIPKRYEIAKDVLLTCTRDIKYGLLPNGYSEVDNSPLYNSADSSLLLFEQVQKYLEYTNDDKFIKENIYPKLKLIIENYSKGIDFDNNNIHLEDDGLISSGTENTQNTWMDAKYGDFAFTPRNGKVVEINALWYNALKIMEVLSKKYEKLGKRILSKKYSQMAEECKESFNKKFYNGRRKCLYDVIGDGKIRPNQLFSLALTYPVVDPSSEIAENIINVVEKKLLNNYGLKTLAKGEKNYVDIYEGDGFRRDASYHQGITWPWLLGLYYNSLRNMKAFEKDKEKKKAVATKIDEFKKRTEKTFRKEMNESGCIGSISELYDSKSPYLPKGAFAQGWSVAEVFRIIFG